MIFAVIIAIATALSAGQLTVELSFSTDQVNMVNVDGYWTVRIDGGYLWGEPGQPELPAVPINVLLPPGKKAKTIEIDSINFVPIAEGIIVKPIQKPAIRSLPRNTRFEFVEPDPEIYYSPQPFPARNVILSGSGNFLGFSIAGIVIIPFRYFPKTGRLEIAQKISLSITYESSSFSHPAKRSPTSDLVARNLVKSIVVNPKMADHYNRLWTWDPSSHDYLIIAPDSFDGIPAMESFRLTLKRMGWNDTLVRLSDVFSTAHGEDWAAKVRNKIRELWLSEGVVAVALIGDSPLIPLRYAYAMDCEAGITPDENYIPCDLYFSDLDGDWNADHDTLYGEVSDSIDLYPDVFVGRIAVNNTLQLENWVRKFRVYVENPPDSFADKALFLAEILWHSPLTDAGVGKDMIHDESLPPHFELVRLYESMGNESLLSAIAELNKGYNVINHDGHAFYSGMGVGTGYLNSMLVDRLVNYPRCGVLYSIGCWPAAFDYDCVAEHFLTNRRGGTIAFVGNSRYGWGSPGNPGYGYSDIYDRLFWHNVFSGIPSPGGALAAVKARLAPLSRWENVWRWKIYEVNVLGEPTAPIWQQEPDSFAIELPDMVPPTGGNIAIPLYECVITALQDGRVIGRAYGLSDSLLSISPVSSAPVEVVLFDPNGMKKMSVETLLVGHGPFLSMLAISPKFVLPKDTVDLRIRLKQKSGDCVGFSILPRAISGCEVLSYTTPPETLREGDTFNVTLRIAVDSTVGIDSIVRINLNAICGGDTLLRAIAIPVKKPIIKILRIVGDMCWNGLDSFTFTNTGNANFNGCIKIIPLDSLVLDRDTLCFTIGVGETLIVPAGFGIISAFGEYVRLEYDYKYGCDTFYIPLPSPGYGARVFDDDVDHPLSRVFNPTGDWHICDERAHSNIYSYHCADTLTGFYRNNADEWLVSRALIALDEPVLSYWLNYDVTTYGTDGLYTYIITNYDTIQLDYIGAGGALPPFLTFHMGWARFEYSIPLSFGDTFRVAFRFVSDSSETAQGFFVDDITVSGLSTEWMGSVWEKPDRSGVDIICAPNPFNKTVTITLDGISSGKIYIFDVLGRLVYRGKLAGKPVVWQPSALNSGVYFVRIVGQGKVASKRILYIK